MGGGGRKGPLRGPERGPGGPGETRYLVGTAISHLHKWRSICTGRSPHTLSDADRAQPGSRTSDYVAVKARHKAGSGEGPELTDRLEGEGKGGDRPPEQPANGQQGSAREPNVFGQTINIAQSEHISARRAEAARRAAVGSELGGGATGGGGGESIQQRIKREDP